jgi:NTE family protein
MRKSAIVALAALRALGGSATRLVNPPLAKVEPHAGYRLQTRREHVKDQEDLVILASSGGGTRAAASPCGVPSPQLRRRARVHRARP